jgi:hypothetical protein
MDEKWRADKEAGFREEDGEVEDEDRVEEKKQGRNNQIMGKRKKALKLRRIREEFKDKAMKEEEEEMEAKATVDLNLEALKREGDGKTEVIETMKVMTFKISSSGKEGISQMEKKKKM